jgi:hypothetical protein
LGDDHFPYGVDGRNGPEHSRFPDLAHGQGLTRRRLAVEELVDGAAAACPGAARMTRGVDLAGTESLNGLGTPRTPVADRARAGRGSSRLA